MTTASLFTSSHATAQEDPAELAEGRFGRRVARELSAGIDELPHGVSERLRAARSQALARRKVVQARAMPAFFARSGGTATAGGRWWTRVATAVPLVALVVGLVVISMVQDERRASELADVDAALLTDELPPAAYTDPGFLQYLRNAEAPPGR